MLPRWLRRVLYVPLIKAKAPAHAGLLKLTVPDLPGTFAKQRQITSWRERCQCSKSTHWPPNFNRLDGREEDRGIEPLWLLPAVQGLANVPSTHTGSVLQSNACHGRNGIGGNKPKFVIVRTVIWILLNFVPEWDGVLHYSASGHHCAE